MSQLSIPSIVLIGKDALEESKNHLKALGNRAFIVTGKHVAKSPMIEELKKLLEEIEVAYYVYDGITGEPTDQMIAEGVALFHSTGCKYCIGIGGGSPLDAAKAIAAMVVNKGTISDLMGQEIAGDIPPIVSIPTTAGTGSEATKFTIITDVSSDVKMLLKGECLIPKIAIIDSDFTVDMPKSVTRATGMDALTHAIEAFTSKKAFCLTDTYAISAVKRILTYLPIVYKNGFDVKAREQMSIAAFEAGVCINNSSVTIVHGMSRPIGALFHVPHGISNAMLLKDCLEFILDGAYDRFAILARECNLASIEDSDEDASYKFLDKIVELCNILEIPTLQQYGIRKDEFYNVLDKMASDAIASGSPSNTRKMITKEECIMLYKKAYNG